MKKRYKRLGIVYGCIALFVIVIVIWWFLFKDNSSGSITFIEDGMIIEYGDAYDVKQLVESVDGELKELPQIDTKKIGKQSLDFIVTKNGKDKTFSYTVEIKDTKPPVIDVVSEEYHSISLNETFVADDYIISVSDPVDGELVKSDQEKEKGTYWFSNDVNTTESGNYTLTIYAMDMSGNEAQKSINIEVIDNNTYNNTYNNNIDPTECEPLYVNGILLVNKNHPLPPYFGALDPTAASALAQLQAAAQNEGYSIPTISGFRDYEYQVGLYNYYVERDGIDVADTYSARPGFSEHQTGLVFDVGAIDNNFGETAEGIWLREHCHEYGFIIRYPEGKEAITGYMYEPWHIRYVGVAVATEIYQRNITLEEYLGVY